jgi:hypothetical protein
VFRHPLISPWVTLTSVLRARLSTRRPSVEHICCNRLTRCTEAAFWILMIRASGRSFASDDAYKSLQMQMIGRRSGLWPLFFSFECAETWLASRRRSPKRSCSPFFFFGFTMVKCNQFLNEPRGLTRGQNPSEGRQPWRSHGRCHQWPRQSRQSPRAQVSCSLLSSPIPMQDVSYPRLFLPNENHCQIGYKMNEIRSTNTHLALISSMS